MPSQTSKQSQETFVFLAEGVTNINCHKTSKCKPKLSLRSEKNKVKAINFL